jgi:hypothetical protein
MKTTWVYNPEIKEVSAFCINEEDKVVAVVKPKGTKSMISSVKNDNTLWDLLIDTSHPVIQI